MEARATPEPGAGVGAGAGKLLGCRRSKEDSRPEEGRDSSQWALPRGGLGALV